MSTIVAVLVALAGCSGRPAKRPRAKRRPKARPSGPSVPTKPAAKPPEPHVPDEGRSFTTAPAIVEALGSAEDREAGLAALPGLSKTEWSAFCSAFPELNGGDQTASLKSVASVSDRLGDLALLAIAGKDSDAIRFGAERLKEIGAAAIGGLVTVLDTKCKNDSVLAGRIGDLLRDMDAASAAEALLDGLANSKLSEARMVALTKLGEAAVPHLVTAAGTASAETVEQFLRLAIEIDAVGKRDVVVAATQASESSGQDYQQAVYRSLEAAGPELWSALLDSPSENMRKFSTIQLGRMGAKAASAAPQLAKLLDEDAMRRPFYAGALFRLGPTAAPHAIPALIRYCERKKRQGGQYEGVYRTVRGAGAFGEEGLLALKKVLATEASASN